MSRKAAASAIAALLTCILSGTAQAQQAVEIREFGNNPGNLRMYQYVPQGLPADAPLVVALHGCKQNARDYGRDTGWIGLADKMHFALLLPEQQQVNNDLSCFNWFQPEDITPDKGEAASIRAMIGKMQAVHGNGPIYISGLSAGGAMTAVMLADYPQLFAAGGIVAGLPYRCAASVGEALFPCMAMGKNLSPQQWGDLARQASGFNGPWPRISIWHGGQDQRVKPSNMTELMEQWTNLHGIGQTPANEGMLKGYPHKVYKDAAGAVAVETVLVPAMPHAQPVDPGPAPDQCGKVAAYIEDRNICAAYHFAQFWGLDDAQPPGRPGPKVTLTAPADGASLSGPVTIKAQTENGAQVARVDFLIDGALRRTDTAAPWEAEWDPALDMRGPHRLTAKAFDAAGTAGTSPPVTVTTTVGLAGGLTESFSDRDRNGDPADTPVWTLGGWKASPDNHSPDAAVSGSMLGVASSGAGCRIGGAVETISATLPLGPSPKLSYARKLDLHAGINMLTAAGFTVSVDGTPVDEEKVVGTNYTEPNWAMRRDIDLAAFANRNATITFAVSANSNVCLETYARAWIDDVQIAAEPQTASAPE